MHRLILMSFALLLLGSVFSSLPMAADSDVEFTLVSQVEWQALNPARGDKGPQAATLWGDRNGLVPTGFLVKFVDGFSSPPHIHNVSYRGVVIDGLIHNDDPNAEKMWMPSASFWTQPAGESHITAAKGEHNVAYIEIDRGPYLVRPIDKSFDNGERPVNVDASNLVWLDVAESSGFINESNKAIQLAYLWGQPLSKQLYGALVRLPAGQTTEIINHGDVFHAVLIQGQLSHQVSDDHQKRLTPGSYFNAKKESIYDFTTSKDKQSILYFRTNGSLSFSIK